MGDTGDLDDMCDMDDMCDVGVIVYMSKFG